MSPVDRADGTGKGRNLKVDNLTGSFLRDAGAEVMIVATMHLCRMVLLVKVCVQHADGHQHEADVRKQA